MSLIQKRDKKCQTTPKFIEFRIGENGTNRADRRTMGTTTAYHETARVLHHQKHSYRDGSHIMEVKNRGTVARHTRRINLMENRLQSF